MKKISTVRGLKGFVQSQNKKKFYAFGRFSRLFYIFSKIDFKKDILFWKVNSENLSVEKITNPTNPISHFGMNLVMFDNKKEFDRARILFNLNKEAFDKSEMFEKP